MDINTASVDDLKSVPNVGEDRAQDIVSYREENGAFGSLDDVKNIPGFSDDMVTALRDGGVSVGGD